MIVPDNKITRFLNGIPFLEKFIQIPVTEDEHVIFSKTGMPLGEAPFTVKVPDEQFDIIKITFLGNEVLPLYIYTMDSVDTSYSDMELVYEGSISQNETLSIGQIDETFAALAFSFQVPFGRKGDSKIKVDFVKEDYTKYIGGNRLRAIPVRTTRTRSVL